eukprot:TRINITY_DN14184_c0_g1_i1.p1 TRINITY_DN14184_c0_g1~~TRINITY_DN14184_c0_g1_i1.p1  ORF type:complete len:454 (+),score=89.50 TRINITY_DN14184_c0_g1_i1:142-1503(+)
MQAPPAASAPSGEEFRRSTSSLFATGCDAQSAQARTPLQRLRRKTSLKNNEDTREGAQVPQTLALQSKPSGPSVAPEACLWTSLQRLRRKTSLKDCEDESKDAQALLTLATQTRPSQPDLAAEASLWTSLQRLRRKTSFENSKDTQVPFSRTLQPSFSSTLDDELSSPKLQHAARALDDELCPAKLRRTYKALDDEPCPPKLRRAASQQLQDVFKDVCAFTEGAWQPRQSAALVRSSCAAACRFALLGEGSTFEVLSYLEAQELIACMAVERSWCNPSGWTGEVLCSDALWRPVCIRRWASKATRFHVDTPEREQALRAAHPGSSWKRLFQLAEADAQRRELTPAELKKFVWKAHPRPSTEELMPGVSFGGQCVTFAQDGRRPYTNSVSEMYLVVRLQNWEWLLLGLGCGKSFISAKRRCWNECADSEVAAAEFEESLLSEASLGELVPVQVQ